MCDVARRTVSIATYMYTCVCMYVYIHICVTWRDVLSPLIHICLTWLDVLSAVLSPKLSLSLSLCSLFLCLSLSLLSRCCTVSLVYVTDGKRPRAGAGEATQMGNGYEDSQVLRHTKTLPASHNLLHLLLFLCTVSLLGCVVSYLTLLSLSLFSLSLSLTHTHSLLFSQSLHLSIWISISISLCHLDRDGW